MRKERELLVTHSYANYPPWIAKLQEESLKSNKSVSKIIREGLDLYFERERKRRVLR